MKASASAVKGCRLSGFGESILTAPSDPRLLQYRDNCAGIGQSDCGDAIAPTN